MRIFSTVIVLFCALTAAAQGKKPLVERLGFPAGTRVLIINADDFGMNQAGTEATITDLKSGITTSTTVMVPCPWFPLAADFARKSPKANIGVHTTLTSEWSKYKWGPVLGRTAVPSLVDKLGYLFPGVEGVYASAVVKEVEAEVRAQVDKALAAGIDVTHIDSHMGTMQYDPKYHELYLKIAKDYNLPCRVAGRELMRKFQGEHLVDMADSMGVLHPDFLYMVGPAKVPETDAFWTEQLKGVKPGIVSEIFFHAGLDTPEMNATTGTARQRTADSVFFGNPSTRELIKSLGIELISYRELRELQRTGKPLPRVPSYGW